LIEAVPEVFTRDHVAHRDSNACDLAGEELGVVLCSLSNITIVLGRDAVPTLLP